MSEPLGRVRLGTTGPTVSPLALGTAPLSTFFWGNDEATAVATVERALGLGINFFDSAPLYGSGEAELRLGRALRGVPRDSVVVTTKVGRLLVPGADGEPVPTFDFSADAVSRSLESSLARLGLDRVDVVHVHDPEEHLEQALGEAVPALCALRDEGVISVVSVGTNVVATASRFVADGAVDAVMVAGRLTLLDRSAADELVPACAAAGVAYLAAAPFNSGVLARPVDGAWYDYAPAPDDVRARADRYAEACRRHGVSLAAAALQYPSRIAGVTAVVAGMASPREVDANVAAFTAELPDELWEQLAPQ